MKEKLLDNLINYLEAHYDCTDQSLDEFGFGMVILENKTKEKELIIDVDEDTRSDCKFRWYIKPKNEAPTKQTYSNFEHLTNTVIRIFME